jgi:ferredoxin
VSTERLLRLSEPGQRFQVELRRSGIVLDIPPDESILDVVRTVLPAQPFSCTQGICGTCETAVLEGEIDHRDSVLDEDEQADNTTMMICVSRALSERLVLDL